MKKGKQTLYICAGEYHGSKSLKAFTHYAVARYGAVVDNEVYRVYLTDALYVGLQTLARENRGWLKQRYADLIKPAREETRTPEEIIGGIKSKLAKNRGGKPQADKAREEENANEPIRISGGVDA